MRETSRAAYRALRSRLPESRFEVYDDLFIHGPATGHELDVRMDSPDAHKRLSEMKEQGVVQEVTERACTITGRVAIEWDVTSRTRPLALDRKPTRKELEKRIDELEEQVRHLTTYRDNRY